MVKINKSGKLNNTIQYKQNKQHKQIIYNISAKLLIKIYEPLTEKYTIWMKYTVSPTWHNSWWSIKTQLRPDLLLYKVGQKLPLCCYSLPISRDVLLSTLIRQIGLCIGTKTDLQARQPQCSAQQTRLVWQKSDPFTNRSHPMEIKVIVNKS